MTYKILNNPNVIKLYIEYKAFIRLFRVPNSGTPTTNLAVLGLVLVLVVLVVLVLVEFKNLSVWFTKVLNYVEWLMY